MEVEEEKFAARLDGLLPLLERETSPNNYEDVSPSAVSGVGAGGRGRTPRTH